MGARRFFYVAAGLLFLAAPYSPGAREATAGFVDHTATGPVIAITGGDVEEPSSVHGAPRVGVVKQRQYSVAIGRAQHERRLEEKEVLP